MPNPRSLARACALHPRRTLLAWLAVLLLSFACIGTMLDLSSEGDLTGKPESRRAENLVVANRLFEQRPVTEIVVVRSERHTVGDAAFGRYVAAFADEVASGPVQMEQAGERRVSRDRHALAVPLTVFGQPGPLEDAVRSRAHDADFRVAVFGDEIVNDDFDELSQHDLKKGELFFGLPVALVILLLVFGSVVAALVPLAMAIVSILVALGLTAIAAQFTDLSIFVVNMISGMGLALGIDYALFVVSRYREERARGREPLDAIEVSGATASRAVLVSGSAFVVAMAGMLIVPHTVMRSLALGAIVVGIASVAAALTLLPALLGLLGDRVNAVPLPYIGRAVTESAGSEGRWWAGIVRASMRRPVVTLVAATAALLLAAVPVLGLKTGSAGVSTLPDRLLSKQGYLALQRDFAASGTNPVWVVFDGRDPRGVAAVVAAVRREPAFGRPTTRSSGDVTLVSFPVAGDSTGERATDAVRHLRSGVIASSTDVPVLVGGDTAAEVDYQNVMRDYIPIVFAFVLGLTFVLLTVVFRSIVIALKAIVLNLLSVGAAYGLLVLVFRHGWLGFEQVDRIEPWVPLFLFSVLFGLSMDYHVFLLSRIRERVLAGESNTDAVARGVGTTARLITGAAAIIVAVFVGFASGDLVPFQQMGFGVAVSLIIDATILRSVILPAAMKLLGEWNWYLPRWLEWLPRVAVE
jgi:putative drug exporter of the RND superfamily